MVKLILDCDPGIDDALAIIMAARTPEVNLLGITAVAGNLPLSVTTGNATALAKELALPEEIKIWPGAAGPLHRELIDAGSIHGQTGLGYWCPRPDWSRVGLDHAAAFIAGQASRHPGEVVLVATGPLTNLAILLENHPQEAAKLARIVFMGGALRVPGNVTHCAEFNIWDDPEAAEAVLASSLSLTMVGLDVTRQVILSQGKVKCLKGKGALARRAAEMVEYYLDNQKVEDFPLHDPLALMAALRPSLFRFEKFAIKVETGGNYSRGQTVVVPGDPVNVQVATEVNVSACLDWLLSTL